MRINKYTFTFILILFSSSFLIQYQITGNGSSKGGDITIQQDNDKIFRSRMVITNNTEMLIIKNQFGLSGDGRVESPIILQDSLFNLIDDNGSHIYLENTDLYFTIQDSLFEGSQPSESFSAIILNNVSNVKIIRNEFNFLPTSSAIRVRNSNVILISNNDFTTLDLGVEIYGGNQIKVISNHFVDIITTAILAKDSEIYDSISNFNVTENYIDDAPDYGIRFSNLDNFNVFNNSIGGSYGSRGIAPRTGILIESSTNGSIDTNLVLGSSFIGISVTDSFNLEIDLNYVFSQNVGFESFGLNDSIISANNFIGEIGMILRESNRNIISFNYINGENDGLVLNQSEDNFISLNTIVAGDIAIVTDNQLNVFSNNDLIVVEDDGPFSAQNFFNSIIVLSILGGITLFYLIGSRYRARIQPSKINQKVK